MNRGVRRMLRDIITEAELRALLGDAEAASAMTSSAGGNGASAAAGSPSSLDADDRKLLHALVRNQLRLLHMIEEMQAELRMLKAVSPDGPAAKQTSAGLEPLPLPFMKQGAGESRSEEETSLEHSRKERFKRKSFW